MAPSFVRTMRERGLPEEPPIENPHEVARQQWEALREYATKVAEVARETDDANKALMAENESLRRENDHLYEQVDKISREYRATSAFAESLRTRLKSIEEQIAAALQESMEYAQRSAREPARAHKPDESFEREVRKVMSISGTTLPANAY